MHVKRVISNNAVLAVDDEGKEIVALGRGIGHAHRPGATLKTSTVEQVFFAGEGTARDQLALLLAEIPLPCVRAAVAIGDVAHERLGLRVTQALILPLADHLNFAIQRHRDGIPMQYPLRWEVSQLYPTEFETAGAAVDLASSMLGMPLDQGEAVAIALHLVNANLASPGLSKAVEMTEIIARAFEVIEQSFALDIDQTSVGAARFVTHLRYLFSRISSGKQIEDPHPTLGDAISNAHPEAMTCAAKVRYLLEMRLNATITPDETAYLALHIAKLVWDAHRQDGE